MTVKVLDSRLKKKRHGHVSVVLPPLESSSSTTLSTEELAKATTLPAITTMREEEIRTVKAREVMTEETVNCTWSEWSSCSYFCGQPRVPTKQQVLVDVQPKSMKAMCQTPKENCSRSIKCTGMLYVQECHLTPALFQNHLSSVNGRVRISAVRRVEKRDIFWSSVRAPPLTRTGLVATWQELRT